MLTAEITPKSIRGEHAYAIDDFGEETEKFSDNIGNWDHHFPRELEHFHLRADLQRSLPIVLVLIIVRRRGC
jgi:hypothetical protein